MNYQLIALLYIKRLWFNVLASYGVISVKPNSIYIVEFQSIIMRLIDYNRILSWYVNLHRFRMRTGRDEIYN